MRILLDAQQGNASLKQLSQAAAILRAQLRGMKTDSAEFAAKTAEFQKVNGRLQQMNAELRGTGNSFKELKNIVGGFTLAGILQTGIAKVTAAFKDGIDTQRQFGKSLANLSAITGVTGKDLDFYGERAIELGRNVKGGAVAVLEAFKLIGSAKPELLNSKQGMNEVTEAAILLSHATGMELPESATKLTDALNQYNAAASESKKYVDALAAASKYGAAEVPQVTDALLQFGTAAKSFNVDIYESAATIELFAEKGLKGAEAGTALRNIFAKMAAADVLPDGASKQLEAAGVNIDVLKNKSIPLIDRLTEFSKISGNAAAITKVFGLENKIAGEIIISNLPRLQELTRQVKETGVAAQQAKINMDTFDQSIVNAASAWDSFILSLSNGKVGGIMKGIVDGWTSSLETWSQYLSGTRGKNIDLKSLMMVGNMNLVNEEQAKKLMDYGFKVDFVNGKIDKQRMSVINLMLAMEAYTKNISAENTTSKSRADLMNNLRAESDKLTIAFNAGKISAADYQTSLKLITEAMEKVGKVAPKMMASEAIKQEPGLIKRLQDEIESLMQKRINSVSRAEIMAMNEQIKQKQAQLDILMGKEDENAKRIKERYAALMRDLENVANQVEFFNADDLGREWAKIWKEYETLRDRIESDELLKRKDKAKEKRDALLLIETDRENKITALGKKHADARTKELENLFEQQKQLTLSQLELEVYEIEKKHNILITELKKQGLDYADVENAKQKAIADVRKKYQEREEAERRSFQEEIYKATHNAHDVQIREVENYYNDLINRAKQAGEDTIELERAKAEKIAEINDKLAEDNKKKWAELAGQTYHELKDIVRHYADVVHDNEKNSYEAANRKFDKDKEREKRLYDNKLISKEDYDARVQKIDNEQENRKRIFEMKEYARSKREARFNVMLSFLEAEAKTFAKYGFTPMGYVAMGIGAAMAAAKLAIINMQQPPQYADGGLHQPGGYVRQATLFDSSSGQPFIAGEAGAEYIISNPMLRHPVVANALPALEAIRTGRSFAQGGSSGTTAGSTGSAANTQGNQQVPWDKVMAALNNNAEAMQRLNATIQGGIGVNYDLLQQSLNSVNNAKGLSQVK